MNYFSWTNSVYKAFSKSFPASYSDDTLYFLHKCIKDEFLRSVKSKDEKSLENLFFCLGDFYKHFCWKIKWQDDSMSFMKRSCISILSYFIQVGVVLSGGKSSTKWIDSILTAMKIFPGPLELLYDSLILVYNVKEKFRPSFGAILKHFLYTNKLNVSEVMSYFKIMLLLRRLKFISGDKRERAKVVMLASRIKVPPNTGSWLLSNGIKHCASLNHKLFSKLFLGKKWPPEFYEELRKALKVEPRECLTNSLIVDNKRVNADKESNHDFTISSNCTVFEGKNKIKLTRTEEGTQSSFYNAERLIKQTDFKHESINAQELDKNSQISLPRCSAVIKNSNEMSFNQFQNSTMGKFPLKEESEMNTNLCDSFIIDTRAKQKSSIKISNDKSNVSPPHCNITANKKRRISLSESFSVSDQSSDDGGKPIVSVPETSYNKIFEYKAEEPFLEEMDGMIELNAQTSLKESPVGDQSNYDTKELSLEDKSKFLKQFRLKPSLTKLQEVDPHEDLIVTADSSPSMRFPFNKAKSDVDKVNDKNKSFKTENNHFIEISAMPQNSNETIRNLIPNMNVHILDASKDPHSTHLSESISLNSATKLSLDNESTNNDFIDKSKDLNLSLNSNTKLSSLDEKMEKSLNVAVHNANNELSVEKSSFAALGKKLEREGEEVKKHLLPKVTETDNLVNVLSDASSLKELPPVSSSSGQRILNDGVHTRNKIEESPIGLDHYIENVLYKIVDEVDHRINKSLFSKNMSESSIFTAVDNNYPTFLELSKQISFNCDDLPEVCIKNNFREASTKMDVVNRDDKSDDSSEDETDDPSSCEKFLDEKESSVIPKLPFDSKPIIVNQLQDGFQSKSFSLDEAASFVATLPHLTVQIGKRCDQNNSIGIQSLSDCCHTDVKELTQETRLENLHSTNAVTNVSVSLSNTMGNGEIVVNQSNGSPEEGMKLSESEVLDSSQVCEKKPANVKKLENIDGQFKGNENVEIMVNVDDMLGNNESNLHFNEANIAIGNVLKPSPDHSQFHSKPMNDNADKNSLPEDPPPSSAVKASSKSIVAKKRKDYSDPVLNSNFSQLTLNPHSKSEPVEAGNAKKKKLLSANINVQNQASDNQTGYNLRKRKLILPARFKYTK